METGLPPPRTPDPQDAPPLRWGVLGPGSIAASFVAALAAGTRQEVVAVGSRSSGRARAFAARFGVPHAHGSYEGLAGDADVDVVYVATPHSEHLANALLAVGSGKHVLVEKAFTRNAAQAEQLVAAARERGVFLMEAMWTRFLPGTDVVRQLLAGGALGEVRTVLADHGQFMEPDPSSRLFDPALAGGALLDLGVYPVSFASMVLGGAVSTTAVGTRAMTGVDAQVSIVMVGAQGAHAVLSTTLSAKTPTTASISGTLARLELDGDFYAPTTIRLVDRAGELRGTFVDGGGSAGLAYEAAEVARCVTAGRGESRLMPLDETLLVMRTLDAVRAQVGVTFPGER